MKQPASPLVRSIAMVIALVLCGTVMADSSTGVIRTSNGYEYTSHDAQQAVAAYYRMASDHSFTEVTELVPSREMPAWDPVAHYVGLQQLPNGESGYVVWLNELYRSALSNPLGSDAHISSQVIGAMLMAAIDGKLAGPKWKSFFDDATRKDHLLGPNVADPFHNRHALVAKLASDRSLFRPLEPTGVFGVSGTMLTGRIPYSPGLVGYAQVGIGIARITELLDDRAVLAEPQSQRFIDDCFAHFARMLPDEDARATLRQQRNLLVVNASFDRVRNGRAFTQSMGTLANGLSHIQRSAFLIGSYSEQEDYNAAVTRQARLDTVFRSGIAQTSELDAALPRLAGMRQHLAGLSPQDWKGLAKQSEAMVQYILSAP